MSSRHQCAVASVTRRIPIPGRALHIHHYLLPADLIGQELATNLRNLTRRMRPNSGEHKS